MSGLLDRLREACAGAWAALSGGGEEKASAVAPRISRGRGGCPVCAPRIGTRGGRGKNSPSPAFNTAQDQ
jgi:hypothetical protein